MYIAICKDFEVTDVFDLSIGSGAAAIGTALSKQFNYFGVCYNSKHMAWVRRHLHQCYLAMVSDGRAKVDGEIVKKVKQYFQISVSECRQFFERTSTSIVYNGEDDSDLDET